jgi:hypothetical protein
MSRRRIIRAHNVTFTDHSRRTEGFRDLSMYLVHKARGMRDLTLRDCQRDRTDVPVSTNRHRQRVGDTHALPGAIESRDVLHPDSLRARVQTRILLNVLRHWFASRDRVDPSLRQCRPS